MTKNLCAEDISFLAASYGWELYKHRPEFSQLLFKRDGVLLIVWHNRMTVQTMLKHPKKGRTQLTRKSVDIELLEKIFDNPRVHTKKGYINKPLL